jgi:hypothetical protein
MKGRWTLLPGVASLLAAAVLTAGLFPPAVSQGCPGCSELTSAGLPAGTFWAGPDTWAAIWIIALIVAAAALFLAGVAARLVATVSALASLAAVGLALYNGAVMFPRTLPAELVPGVPVYYVLDAGYYLFLLGGIVAVGGATGMLLLSGDSADCERRWLTPRSPIVGAVGWVCLASLTLASVGAFLPFGALNCGFGCPPFQGATAVSSGPIVEGTAGWAVLLVLLAAGAATLLRIADRRKPLSSCAALALSLLAAVLVSFEGLNGGSGVLGWPFSTPIAPEWGYYVMQIGTALAVVASFVLVAAERPSLGLRRPGDFRTQGATHLA